MRLALLLISFTTALRTLECVKESDEPKKDSIPRLSITTPTESSSNGINLVAIMKRPRPQRINTIRSIDFKTFYPILFAFSAGEDKIPISKDESRHHTRKL